MSTIFISHSSADNALAQELAQRLAQQGHNSVFLDLDPEKGIVAGRSWERTLYRKLRACRAVIALCTDSYLASQWCFAEIALARMEGKQILAMLADPLRADAQLPSILSEKQFIDLRTNPEDGYRRLWRGLEELDLLGEVGDWDIRQPPYLGLNAFHEEHAPVFFGRENEIRQGIEILDRGAPGLVMILGTSGSGKSSLARAGIVPRLRRDTDHWLVVDTFRPGRDPFGELADALSQSFRRAAPDASPEYRDRAKILHQLRSWKPQADTEEASPGDDAAPLQQDDRLTRLLHELEALKTQAELAPDTSLMDFLDWSLEDLRRICNREPAAVPGARQTTALTELAYRLRRTAKRPNARILLVVDQFEELLGAGADGREGRRLLEQLAASLAGESRLLSVLVTMRSDFLETFQRANASLGMDFETMSLGPMPVEGIRRVIEAPAKLGAIELESGLADRLIADASDTDALPLLSFTLWRMWRDEHETGMLTLAAYDRLGGLNGAVTGEAEAILKIARGQKKESALRRAFQTMVCLADDGQFARKPAAWDSEALQPVHDLLEAFIDRRLLVVRAEDGARVVELAHEALFRTWKPLRQWTEEQRAKLVLRHQLDQSSAAWADDGRAAEHLWRGARLAQAVQLLESGAFDGDDQETRAARAFVRASEAMRKRQSRRRRNLVVATTSVLIAFLAYAVINEDDAKRQHRKAAAQESSMAAIRDLPVDPMKSLRRAQSAICLVKAFDGTVPQSAHNALNRAVQAVQRQRLLKDHKVGVSRVQFIPGAGGDSAPQRLMSLDRNDVWMSWDLAGTEATGCAAVPAAEVSAVAARSLAVDPGGRFVAYASGDGVHLHGLEQHTEQPPSVEVTRFPTDAAAIVIAPDGSLLAATDQQGALHVARISADGQPGDVKNLPPQDGRIEALVFTGDSDTLATGSQAGLITVRNAGTGAVLHRLEGHSEAITKLVAHDGYLVSGSWDKTIRVWDLATGALRQTLEHEAVVSDLAVVSEEGAEPLLISASWDGTARVWDMQGGQLLYRLEHDAPVVTLAVAPPEAARSENLPPNTLQIATGGWNGKTWLWTVGPGSNGAAIFRIVANHTQSVNDLAFSEDGQRLASGSDDSSIHVTRLYDHVDALNWRGSLDLGRSEAGHTWFAVMVRDGVRVLDATTGEQRRRVTGYEGAAQSMAFHDDGAQKLVIRADRIFEYFLDERELMYCADRLRDGASAARPFEDYSLSDRCRVQDFPATYQSLLSRLRLLLGLRQ